MTTRNNCIKRLQANDLKSLIDQWFIGQAKSIDGSIFYRHAWGFAEIATGRVFTPAQFLAFLKK